ncbi:putative ubiquitin-protein ligase [Naematelia encephala]|uniref:Cullin-1 n=1 Tax=Naematelia encephala TaxID=71784 RepID=A0A1Y2BAJ3_9TREE|nr:putative ubiquitin-protein ligase [Naematelia encephala]
MSSSSAQGSSTTWREPTKDDKPPRDADLSASWAFLQVGVDHIMTRLQLGMSYSYYILLYTAIYDYCTGSRQTSSFGSGANRGGASLQGADLYRSLHNYLSSHCKGLRDEAEKLSDLELLKFYAKQWERYTTGANYVNKLFNYLNKHWVKREKDEGRKEVYTVYTLALVAWKQNFFRHFTTEKAGMSRLTSALLSQIKKQRDGEVVDSGLMKKVIDSYVSLGLDEADAQRQQLDVYKEYFQTPFLDATSQYYSDESAAFVASNSVSDYMKKAEMRLQEEEDRVNLYLHDNTRKDLKERCETVLITAHAESMWEEFQSLLDADKNDDLARMYNLLSRIPSGLEPLRKKFEEHVKRAGLAAVQKVLPAPGSVNEAGKAESLDPKAYVEALLEVNSKYSDVVNNPFRGEVGFNTALDQACRVFFNENAACPTPTRSPELLASYCDILLKKNNKDMDADSLEAALNRVMIIFKFIDDKDVFQKFYQRNLAKRLVNEASASEDSESSMIAKLKDVHGFDYTNKLTRMFTDVSLSRDLTERFKTKERNATHDTGGECYSPLSSIAEQWPVDFNAMILGTNFWPMNPPNTDYTVPREITGLHERFIKYHSDIHSGRKLTFLWHLCKGEIRTTYLSQKYIFMVNAYQLAILCLFNENDSMTYKEIQAGTQISDSTLKAQLALLVKTKVLLEEGETYDLNLSFKNKKIRVQLNMPVKSEQRVETAEVLQAVDEDRKFVYQATIVRLMKARKSMKHQALIQEVTANISTKFTPKVPEIKKAIDYLLDKEYLERVEGSIDTYNYMA